MAAPNLKSDTLVVEPDTVFYHLTETTLTEIIPAVATGYAYFLEQVSVVNIGAVAANVSITIRDGTSAGVDYYIASGRSVQIKSAFNAGQGRAHIMGEGASMYAKVGASGQEVDLVIPLTMAHEA